MDNKVLQGLIVVVNFLGVGYPEVLAGAEGMINRSVSLCRWYITKKNEIFSSSSVEINM